MAFASNRKIRYVRACPPSVAADARLSIGELEDVALGVLPVAQLQTVAGSGVPAHLDPTGDQRGARLRDVGGVKANLRFPGARRALVQGEVTGAGVEVDEVRRPQYDLQPQLFFVERREFRHVLHEED